MMSCISVQTDNPTCSSIAIQTNILASESSAITVRTAFTQTDVSNVFEIVREALDSLSEGACLEALSVFFSKYASVTVPEDFLMLASKAMLQLTKAKRSNVVYNLVRGLGILRTDGGDSRFPTKCMPMGLIEHVTNFFVTGEHHLVRIGT